MSQVLVIKKDAFVNEVSFGFTTIDRRETAYDAVRVIRSHFPDNNLMVLDQNEPTEEARAFYVEYRVDVRFVEYDIGLSAARNQLFDTCPTRYFFMLDDDVVELPDAEIRKSYELLKEDNRVLVVGGRSGKLVKHGDKVIRKINPPFSYFLFHKPQAKFALFFDPVMVKGVPKPYYDRDTSFHISEVVENLALFDVDKYRSLGLSWDNDLKIVAEHLDFYLNVQEKTKGRLDALIVANPRLIAFDIDAVTAVKMEDYRKKRFRQSFRSIYARKWNIAAEMHMGKWMNVHWAEGKFSVVKWADLSTFGERQKVEYKRAGDENIRRHSSYPVGNKRVSFIATTVDRFDAIQALAISIRERFGNVVEILLAIQAEVLPEGFERFARLLDITLVPTGYDIGLSAARNRLIEQVSTDYFVLCDDDFVIDNNFHIGNAIRILDEEPEIDGVGGAYRDVIYNPSMHLDSFVDRHFTFQAAYEPKTGSLVRVPFYHLPLSACFDSERGALPADILQNLALFRTSAFGMSALHWDERMKITGEHLDFYVKNLIKDKKQFVFDPGFSVLHNRVHNKAYREKRSRIDGIELFYEKWGIKYEIDSELGLRAPCRGETRWQPFETN